MPIGMLGIYWLLFIFLFFLPVCPQNFGKDISGVSWRRVMKFCRVVDLRVHQVISPSGELSPRGLAPRPKS